MTAGYENQFGGIELIGQFEQNALLYLDTADAAVALAESHVDLQWAGTIHPEYFEGSGLTDRQFEAASKLGSDIMQNVALATTKGMDSRAPNVFRSTKDLREAASAYQGINAEAVVDAEYIKAHERVVEGPWQPSTDLSELDKRVEILTPLLAQSPYVGDLCTLVGLATVHLAGFLSQEHIQSKAMQDKQFSDIFHSSDPVEQATSFVGTYFISGENATLKRTLAKTLHGSESPGKDKLAPIEAALIELELTKRVRKYMGHEKIFAAIGPIITAAVGEASQFAHQLVDLQPDVGELTDNDITNEVLLTFEGQIVQASKGINRHANTTMLDAKRVSARGKVVLVEFDDNTAFPVAEPELQDNLKAHRATVAAGELAAARTLQQETREQITAELAGLLLRHIGTRSALKRHSEGKRLTTLLVTGRDGGSTLDIPFLGKDEAFDTAGIVVTLEGQLDTTNNRDTFGRLFDAVGREATLRAALGVHTPRQTIGESVAWLSNNMVLIRRSQIGALKKVGDGLAAYRLAQATSPSRDRNARPIRDVSIETLGRIEAFRRDAKQLEIRAFPPGRVDIGALSEDARAISNGRHRAAVIEEERLLVLAGISDFLIDNGHTEVQAFRLLPGSLNQRIPYYAVVLDLGNRKIIVAENPKTLNRTMVFEEVDQTAATWEELVQLDKDAIKEFGGRRMNHVHDKTLDYHLERVQDEVVERILAGTA